MSVEKQSTNENIEFLGDEDDRSPLDQLFENLDNHVDDLPDWTERDDVLRRLYEGIDATDDIEDCWEWTETTTADGYGEIPYVVDGDPALLLTHRATKVLQLNRKIREGHQIHHAECGNKPCSNPHHTEEVTPSEHNKSEIRRSEDPRSSHTVEDAKGVKMFLEHTTLTHGEIAEEAEVSIHFVRRISSDRSWTDVEIPHEYDGDLRSEQGGQRYSRQDVKGVLMFLDHWYPQATYADIADEAEVSEGFVCDINVGNIRQDVDTPHPYEGSENEPEVVLDAKGVKMFLEHYDQLSYREIADLAEVSNALVSDINNGRTRTDVEIPHK